MTDKTDPRLDAAMRASARWHRNEDIVDSDDHSLAWFILEAVDAADRAAGVVRVDTNDEALVSRVAQNWCVHEGVGKNCQPCWFDADNFLVALRKAVQ